MAFQNLPTASASQFGRGKCVALSTGNHFCFLDLYSSSAGYTSFITQDASEPNDIFEVAINPTTCSFFEEGASSGGNDLTLSVGDTTSAAGSNIVSTCTVLKLKSTIV